MGNFDGQVLPGSRASTSNADTTGPVSSGVPRAVFHTSGVLYPDVLDVDVQGARYRTMLLRSGSSTEYLLWANSSGPLQVAPGTVADNSVVSIPIGDLPTGIYTDGTNRVVVTDQGGMDIASVLSVTYLQGGTSTPVVVPPLDYSFDPVSGVITFATLVASSSRGDQFTVTYTLAGVRFNWTRNDPTGTRFGWNGAHRKWEPFKGGSVQNLERLAANGKYSLSPVPNVPVGSYLPGSSVTGQYAMVRLGIVPDESSYPVVTNVTWSGILVVPEDQAKSTYNFNSVVPPLAAVMGAKTGKVFWNPAFTSTHEGEFVWYSPRDFQQNNDGVVGSVLGDLYIAPVPSPLERPILRLGQRAPLTYLGVENETQLAALTVPQGSVGVALSTGKVKLNPVDVAKANPTVGNPSFDKLYLGVNLRYEGIALNRYPQPVQAPVAVQQIGTTYQVPLAAGLPGMGASGLLDVPDGTGNAPDLSLTVKARPVDSGLVRRLDPGFGDPYLFNAKGRVAKVVPVLTDSDLPTNIYSMPGDTAYVSLTTGNVAVSSVLKKVLDSAPVYFTQSLVVPSLYPDGPRLFSRIRDTFTIDTPAKFSFRVDGVNYLYILPALGTYTADQIAVGLNAVLGAGGTAGVYNGWLYIASNLPNGTVSVGFDEESCRQLGYPPGWYVSDPASYNRSDTDPNWLPDTGMVFGLSRSPVNLDGSQDAPDVRATYRVTDAVLSQDVPGIPFQLLNYPPREDIAGYDKGVFFALSGTTNPTSVQVQTPLQPWEDVIYQFDQNRFGWMSPFTFAGQVQQPVSSINLGNAGVIPETFYTVMGGYLKVSPSGGAQQALSLGTDFLVPPGSGTAYLITRIGEKIQSGFRGTVTGNVLTDTSVTIAATNGDRLKITATGPLKDLSFTVVGSTANTITVTPAFPVNTTTNTAWELYKGVDPGGANGIDPSVLADAVTVDFNHLPNEPYEVRLLTNLGLTGGTLSPVDLPTANSGRVLSVRFGQTGTEVPLTVLTNSVLGPISNGPNALFVPNAGTRFTTGAFSLLVGTTLFTNGGNLLPVAAFSPDPGTNIEYLTTTGQLKFGSVVLSQYDTATVVYREEVRAAVAIPAGVAEVSPFTGAVGISSVDAAAHPNTKVYLVDLQTFRDVYLNPIAGTFTFQRPVEKDQLVQVTYLRAVPDSGALYLDSNNNPVQVTEFLPVFIRREQATAINPQLYSFNPQGRTIDTDVQVSILVDTRLVTYGTPPGVSIDFTSNRFSLVKPVTDPATKVLISYGVFEALGGETTYSVSQGPVWRPPFKLTGGVGAFTLLTNRTSEMVAGKVLRLGNYLTYVKGATYDVATDTTIVTIFPTPIKDVGSLQPSDPPINQLSDRPVTPVVDPSGTPVATSADPWFLPPITTAYGLSGVPSFQKVTKGGNVIRFDGDITKYAVVGHLIELFGIPFLIAKSDFVGGTHTEITLGSPSPIEMVWSATLPPGTVRISVRPVYPVLSTVFLGAGGFIDTEPYEVVLFKGNSPGVTLEQGKDYQIDTGAGTLSLLQPRQEGFPSLSSLRFYRTTQDTLAPFQFQKVTQYPRVSASAGYIDPPSQSNGRLGAYLTGTYTFDSPDSFFARSVPLPTYVSETAQGIVGSVTTNAQGSNPSVGAFGKNSPSSNGLAGLTAQRQDLVCLDRVSRTFLRYFNGVITSFEQVLENANGEPIGDRDGKLRLWIGTDDTWTPPGYEDPITGAMNPRNVWSQVWNSFRSTPIALIPSDPIISPLTATLDVNGNPVGQSLPANTLDRLLALQTKYIQNDVDDVVLEGLRDTSIFLSGIISFGTKSYGRYKGLSEPSSLSRLFPERTQAFVTSVPGIGYDEATGNNGVYSFAKLSLDLFATPPQVSLQSTLGSPIAQLANPVLGNITSVLGVDVQDRRARARLFRFSTTGVPSITVRPVFLATVLPLDQFPLNPDGTLDTSGLVSAVGVNGTPDLTSGDPSLHTPPFKPGDQVALGTLDGTTYGLGFAGTAIPVGLSTVYASVFVDQIIQGTYVTLKTVNLLGADVPITTANVAQLVRLTSANTGVPLTDAMVARGDTLYVVPKTGTVIAPPPADPPTTAELTKYTQSLPTYRTGFDVGFDGRTGALVDVSLPSITDPNPIFLKELLGQNPPKPVTNLQATVTFQNGNVSPTKIPALFGQSRMDTGDYSLPYYGLSPTELGVLGTSFASGVSFATLDAVNPPDNPPAPGFPPYVLEAAYPDEIRGDDGAIGPGNPAAMTTSVVLNPPFVPHTGVGPVDLYDLWYVQQDTGGLPKGSTGILSVGAYTTGPAPALEPPRFVSQSDGRDDTTFNVFNIQTYIEAYPPNPAPHATGLRVRQDTTGPTCITTFELIGVPGLVFDDNLGGGGLLPPVGGFNSFHTIGNKSQLTRINILDNTGAFVPTAAVTVLTNIPNPNVLLTAFSISGDNGGTSVSNVGPCFWNTTKLTLETALPFFDFAAYGGGTIIAPGILELPPHDFTIDIEGPTTRTFTILPDRLTVLNAVDTRRAQPRGALNPAGQPIETRLESGKGLAFFFSTLGGNVTLDASINPLSEVNGGTPFTFLPRTFAPFNTSTFGVGGDVGGGLFVLKVMAFEGWNNTSITSTSPIAFSVAPSSRQDTSSAIMTALAFTDRVDEATVSFPHTTKWGDNHFVVIPPTAKGSLGQVLPGDIAVIRSVTDDPGFTYPKIHGKAGTHLIRGVIAPNAGNQRQVTYTAPNGAGDYTTSWLKTPFPTVVSAIPTDLTVSNIQGIIPTRDWAGVPVAQPFVFPSVGRVYVIVDEAGLNSTVPATFAASVVSAAYTSLDTVNMIFQGLNTYWDANGNAITAAQFVAAATAGKKVSGFDYVLLNPQGNGIPENLPGYCNADPGNLPFAAFGFRDLTVTRGAASLSWTANGSGTLVPNAPTTTSLNVYEKIKQDSNVFLPLEAPVYDNIPGAMDMSLTAADWDRLHNPAFPAPAPFALTGVRCFLPGDQWVVDYSGEGGLYVEPSFPKTAHDLADTVSRSVVDNGNTRPLSGVGVRRMSDYLITPPNVGESLLELAVLEVRRPRRFHDLGNALALALLDLRYNYEIRRGITLSVAPSGGYSVLTADNVSQTVPPVVDPLGSSTQLGSFTNKRVNVNPGDVVRFLDPGTGELLDQAEVVKVTGTNTLLLSKKLTYGAGTPFQVYLRVPPVPHEQSNEELLGYATEKTVMARGVDFISQTGGKVPSTNTLKDTDNRDFQVAGVEKGDIVLVDPAGFLTTPGGPHTPQQYGRRPLGDLSVPGRTGYVAGSPARADDNRGYYLVSGVNGTQVTVTPMGTLAGTNGADVTFGNPGTSEYAVYPTIHNSILTGGTEGQIDLRETALPVGTSYTVTAKSIEPFAYKIIRPTKLLTPETVELILAMRERMLSLMELIRLVTFKYGTYFIFQRDQHIRDVGSPLDPESGLGILSMPFLVELLGRWDIAPYANNRQCLGLLDRRFWMLDFRLDTLTPLFGPFVGTPYADFDNNVGRPVEVDRINEALDARDKLRITRYSWLDLRVNRTKGTLENIRRFDAELPKRQAEAEQSLAAVVSIKKAP